MDDEGEAALRAFFTPGANSALKGVLDADPLADSTELLRFLRLAVPIAGQWQATGRQAQ
jgi:hypothetical protein